MSAMILASQLRTGMVIRWEGVTWRVVNADYHAGQGKMGGVCHARLQNLANGSQHEHSFRAELKLDDVAVERRSLEFSYRDGDDCYFMDPDTFDQFPVPATVAGSSEPFLAPQLRLPVEFVGGAPVHIVFPEHVEARIADTAPASHGSDNVWKEATLDNGVLVHVPSFIKIGDVIRLDLATRKYVDRAKGAGK